MAIPKQLDLHNAQSSELLKGKMCKDVMQPSGSTWQNTLVMQSNSLSDDKQIQYVLTRVLEVKARVVVNQCQS